MKKQVYISADYSESNGDRDVVEKLNQWGSDNLHKVDFVDMSRVASGSVSGTTDCRICDLKAEFNRQINASSAVIIIIGNKTKDRTAGKSCGRVNNEQKACECTPYKQNTNGAKPCKVKTAVPAKSNNVGSINSYSYLQHEFEQAKKKGKDIIVLYNSTKCETNWIPEYMSEYKEIARPFWIADDNGRTVGDYAYIKEALGF